MPRISVDLRLRLSPNEVAAPRPPSFARILAQLPTSSSKLLPVSSICEAPGLQKMRRGTGTSTPKACARP